MRPIDHLVLPVTTLNLARSRLTSLGFTVAPDAQHPFGSGNCCVFFENRTYLEPITILDRGAADVAAAEGNVFVRRLKRFAERRRSEGFAMVALKSEDAEADRAAFGKAGLDAGLYEFKRMATLPDGSDKEIGVKLAFAEQAEARDAIFFSCQHLAPEVLYQPDYLKHRNGAIGVAGVTAVAENPADFHILLTAVTGQRELRTTSFGIEADVDGREIAILTPAGFRARYGVEPADPRRGMLFAAFDLRVTNLDVATKTMGSAAERREDRLVVKAAPGLGVVMGVRSEAASNEAGESEDGDDG
jgi:hypothetical protein